VKIYLVILFCVQSLTSPLEESCVAEPLYEHFNSIPDCLAYVDNFRYSLRNNEDLYVTGFCTQKNLNAI